MPQAKSAASTEVLMDKMNAAESYMVPEIFRGFGGAFGGILQGRAAAGKIRRF